MYRKYLRAAYAIEGITSPREKKRIRNYLYRWSADWDPARMPSLAVAFAVLSLCERPKYPGWIPDYQRDACTLSDRIDARLAQEGN